MTKTRDDVLKKMLQTKPKPHKPNQKGKRSPTAHKLTKPKDSQLKHGS